MRVGAEALLGEAGQALPIVERVLDEARAALCAEALGVLSELQRRTLDFVKERKQFGIAIGQFQVLQHRLVDMFMEVEQARSMTMMATLKLGEAERARSRAVSAAKAYVGKACRFVGQNAVQTHGGIGLTDELALSHYFKRAADDREPARLRRLPPRPLRGPGGGLIEAASASSRRPCGPAACSTCRSPAVPLRCWR